MRQNILRVLDYFSFFEYAPLVEEIYTYINTSTTPQELQSQLDILINKDIIYRKDNRYSTKKYPLELYKKKKILTKNKIEEVNGILKVISSIPTVEYIGISGSAAMNNATDNDDIDIFIITRDNTLWLSRFIVLVAKKLFSLTDPSANLLCFNLFFAESSLTLSPTKRNEFTAHEILQVKTIYDNNELHKKLIKENDWIKNFFPNVQIIVTQSKKRLDSSTGVVITFLNALSKKIQISWLNHKKLRWQEENGQLWLLQNDIEDTLKKEKLI